MIFNLKKIIGRNIYILSRWKVAGFVNRQFDEGNIPLSLMETAWLRGVSIYLMLLLPAADK